MWFTVLVGILTTVMVIWLYYYGYMVGCPDFENENRDILCPSHKNLNSTVDSITAAQHKTDIQP